MASFLQSGVSSTRLCTGVFSLGVPVDSLFFIGNQLVATSHTGKVGVWNAVTQHWQVKRLLIGFMCIKNTMLLLLIVYVFLY